jgi:hypothetical protein
MPLSWNEIKDRALRFSRELPGARTKATRRRTTARTPE